MGAPTTLDEKSQNRRYIGILLTPHCLLLLYFQRSQLLSFVKIGADCSRPLIPGPTALDRQNRSRLTSHEGLFSEE